MHQINMLYTLNFGVGDHFLLQGIFPTHWSNTGLLHCRQILYQLSCQRSPKIPQNRNLYPCLSLCSFVTLMIAPTSRAAQIQSPFFWKSLSCFILPSSSRCELIVFIYIGLTKKFIWVFMYHVMWKKKKMNFLSNPIYVLCLHWPYAYSNYQTFQRTSMP